MSIISQMARRAYLRANMLFATLPAFAKEVCHLSDIWPLFLSF